MVRDKVLEKVIKLNHVRTDCQLVDMLTKALGYNQFSNLTCKDEKMKLSDQKEGEDIRSDARAENKALSIEQ